MSDKDIPRGFGLIIIGNEILNGRVRDTHFANALSILHKRDFELCYSLVLPDISEVIERHLEWAFGRPEPFFCCGGIGSTPDDLTRGCAAKVAGVPLEHHPEGVRILTERFGANLNAGRLGLVEFPKGATLIHNPVNRVPGFRILSGHFLPGFPDMASSMMEWVLDNWYPRGRKRLSYEILMPGAKEADLVDIMEPFVSSHPDVTFSSLPRFTATGTEVLLGISGFPADVEKGLDDLIGAIDKAGIPRCAPRPCGQNI